MRARGEPWSDPVMDTPATRLEAALSAPAGVTRLDLRGSEGARLDELPADVARLVSLEHLDVSHNALKALPPLAALTNLQVLDARSNAIETMPSFEKLKGLREVYFGGNRLERIDRWFAWMKKLERFEVHGNRIRYIPFGFSPSALVDLQVGDNDLSTECEPNCGFVWTAVRMILGQKKLVRLGIDGSLLKAADEYFSAAKKLREVDVYGDDLADDDKAALARVLPKVTFRYGLVKTDGPRLSPAEAAPPAAPPTTKKSKKATAPGKPPVDAKRLATAEGRERALDTLARWFVDGLVGARGDDAAALRVIEASIGALYDVREAAGQVRGEYAGHFFRADGVGLGNTGRPVPWSDLVSRVGTARAAELEALFDEAESTVR